MSAKSLERIGVKMAEQAAELTRLRTAIREYVEAEEAFRVVPEDAHLAQGTMDQLMTALQRKDATYAALKAIAEETP